MDKDCSYEFLKSVVALDLDKNSRCHLKNIYFRGDERLKVGEKCAYV